MFSIASGALLAIGAGRLDTWLGANTWFLVAFGVGLVLYWDAIWFGSRHDKRLVLIGRAAVVGDVGWVLASIEVIAATSWLTRSGEVALALITIPVALFAALQLLGIKRVAT